MADNPYQAAAIAESQATVQTDASYVFRSTESLAKWLTALLILSALITAAIGGLDLAGHFLIPGYATNEFVLESTAVAIILPMLAAAAGSVLLYIICVIFFLTWMYRSTVNAHAVRPQGITITPGWSIGYWFIPILHLFRPYQAVCEIFRASQPTDSEDWNSIAIPGVFAGWWFCWVVGNFLSQIDSRAAWQGSDLGGAAVPISIGATILSLTAAILAVLVIQKVSSAQQRRAEQLGLA